jgi:polyisoprenoid-binding protein YceI
MKKNLFKILTVLGIAVLMVSCGKDKSNGGNVGEVHTQTDGEPYTLDVANSSIEWKGYKVLKSEQTTHFGTLNFKEGRLTVKDGKLQSGKFTADIHSLQNIDLEGGKEMKAKLEGHLKSADFFDAEKFPMASYEITKITATTNGDYNTILEGNLTIKGITKPVQFKANVMLDKGSVSIATETTDINRKDFGLNFDMPLENGLLNKEISLQVLIKAQKNK